MRNSLAIELKVSDVKHLRACPDLPDGAFVVPAVSALAMGDLQAVELGQLGHLTIAVRASAVNNHIVLCRERPFPRSAYFAGVCIDDFCAFEKEARKSSVPLAALLGEATLTASQAFT
ncbi:unnamed protein product [Polarella glacialis]|uniref:Uncharacterized protein n=1 Tax=Polarella glacialis TaxID=89957 RepID=A0A813DPK4_POLGL|nr:unnamed protein product [Polarella glacialis]